MMVAIRKLTIIRIITEIVSIAADGDPPVSVGNQCEDEAHHQKTKRRAEHKL
jgi:hypothetical protein